MRIDPTAIAAYRRTAAAVAEGLAVAAEHAATAAYWLHPEDTLGPLGTDFGRVWRQVLGEHETALQDAATVVTTWSHALGAHAATAAALDESTAGTLAQAQDGGQAI